MLLSIFKNSVGTTVVLLERGSISRLDLVDRSREGQSEMKKFERGRIDIMPLSCSTLRLEVIA